MSKVSEMTRDSWIKATFPEWGTWLVEDIENEVVPEGNVAMWWLGCTGIWMKTPGGANITIDLWCGTGKRTHKMKPGHQMANMTGGRLMQPNLRNIPFVFDPFAFKQVGGKYTYPMDKDKLYYHHRRGFEDCFEYPQNIPFRSCL